MTFKNNKGFTLIEIVVVIIIIAILAAILVPNLMRWIDKAKLGTLKSEADTVRSVVVVQVAQANKDGFDTDNVTEADFGSDFWTAVSENANKAFQTTDDTKDGFVNFSYSSGSLEKFVYGNAAHLATYEDGEWTYE